ncbi:hypothetical protein L1887_11051 [Cichorium endivia]|nr:hypothetical protein L1887_11051 [Cichorium endivia]
MSGGGSQKGLRKDLGAIKDSTTVNLAKVNSDYKELDVNIVKATNHVEHPAKEKHMRDFLRCFSLNVWYLAIAVALEVGRWGCRWN